MPSTSRREVSDPALPSCISEEDGLRLDVSRLRYERVVLACVIAERALSDARGEVAQRRAEHEALVADVRRRYQLADEDDVAVEARRIERPRRKPGDKED